MIPLLLLLFSSQILFSSVESAAEVNLNISGPLEIVHGENFTVATSIVVSGDSKLKKNELKIQASATWFLSSKDKDCTTKENTINCNLPTLSPGNVLNFTFTGVDKSSNMSQIVRAQFISKGKQKATGSLNITVEDRELEMIQTCPTLNSYVCREYTCCGWDDETKTCDVSCSSLWSKDRCTLKDQCSWNSNSGRCEDFDCRVLSAEDCNSSSDCMWSNTSCSMLNCRALSKSECQNKKMCSWSKKQEVCNSFQCNLQTSQQDCMSNSEATCFWNGTGCFDHQCQSLNQTTCQAPHSGCFWNSEIKQCVEFACSLLSKNQCNSMSNCSWNAAAAKCESWKCSNLQGNCTTDDFCWYNQTKQVCQDLPCDSLVTKDTCHAYNDTLACTWVEGCTNNNCSRFSTQTECTSKYWCLWANSSCKEEECGAYRTQQDCSLQGQCTWTGSLCSRKSCPFYVFEQSCARLPFCTWNKQCFSFPCIWYNEPDCTRSPFCVWNEICQSCRKKFDFDEDKDLVKKEGKMGNVIL